MATELLDTEIKARITESQKELLKKLARDRHLKLADVIREAVREKIEASVLVEEKPMAV